MRENRGGGRVRAPRKVDLTSADRVLFPDDDVTKGDLYAYYDAVAEVLVPHLRDRPFTMKRYREGIAAPAFFQKQAPQGHAFVDSDATVSEAHAGGSLQH